MTGPPRGRGGCWALALALVALLSAVAPASASRARKAAPLGSVVETFVASAVLGQRVPIAVYLPPGYPGHGRHYPVLYLLHGNPGSGALMLDQLGVEAEVSALIDRHVIQPLVIVAPSDGPFAGTDTEWTDSSVLSNWRWGSFVTNELVGYVDSHFAACTDRAARAIGGLSMGAFGAMNDALHDLGAFGAVTLWSPYFVANVPAVSGAVGSPGWFSSSPLLYLPAMAGELRSLPLRVSFYDTADDLFYAQNLQFAALLAHLKVAYRFATVRGPHNYALWSKLLAGQLTWLSAGEHC